ncbi:MAG: hypothetical protein UU80_C0020G0001, partial [candidate division WWE3 bacterium GW2011_GWA1_41_8]
DGHHVFGETDGMVVNYDLNDHVSTAILNPSWTGVLMVGATEPDVAPDASSLVVIEDGIPFEYLLNARYEVTSQGHRLMPPSDIVEFASPVVWTPERAPLHTPFQLFGR